MASDQRAAGAANLSALPVCLPKVYPPAAISSMQRRMGARCIAHGSKLIAFDDVRRAGHTEWQRAERSRRAEAAAGAG